MTAFALRAGQIVGEDRDHADAWLTVRDGRFDAIGPTPPASLPALDLGDVRIAPGMIDLHIHGRDGYDVMDARLESLEAISASLAHHGITGFLATTVTAGWDRTLDALRTVGACRDRPMPGARVLGAYSEGLFFSCTHRGAHNPAYFLPPTAARLDAMVDAADGMLRVVALAPEIDGAMDMLRHAIARGVRVVLGHTDATYDQTLAALREGASGGVHLFNGMRGIHHREPGCAGALLLERCTVEVIADGIHLHPAILSMISRLKAADDILLISDCMCAGGMADGAYRLGEMDITVRDGVARTTDGSLAGSTLTLDGAVQRLAGIGEVSFREAVHMASLYPARFAGVADTLGSIAPGKQADVAIFDQDRGVVATLVGGRLVHGADAWPHTPSLAAITSGAE